MREPVAGASSRSSQKLLCEGRRVPLRAGLAYLWPPLGLAPHQVLCPQMSPGWARLGEVSCGASWTRRCVCGCGSSLPSRFERFLGGVLPSGSHHTRRVILKAGTIVPPKHPHFLSFPPPNSQRRPLGSELGFPLRRQPWVSPGKAEAMIDKSEAQAQPSPLLGLQETVRWTLERLAEWSGSQNPSVGRCFEWAHAFPPGQAESCPSLTLWVVQ